MTNTLHKKEVDKIMCARVSALVTVLSDNPCERIGKRETCPFSEDDISLVRV
jgi:hypothetical protein